MRFNKISDKESINLLVYLSFIKVISIFNFHLKLEDNIFSHPIIPYTEMVYL